MVQREENGQVVFRPATSEGGGFHYKWGSYPLFEAMALTLGEIFDNVQVALEDVRRATPFREQALPPFFRLTDPTQISWPDLLMASIGYGPKLVALPRESGSTLEGMIPSALVRSEGMEVAPKDSLAVAFRTGMDKVSIVIAAKDEQFKLIIDGVKKKLYRYEWVETVVPYEVLLHLRDPSDPLWVSRAKHLYGDIAHELADLRG